MARTIGTIFSLIIGDAILCPLQLSEHDIGVQSDLDPVAARRTRELLARQLDRHGGRAVGCHFPVWSKDA
jgi:hypothetical protein